MKFQEEKNNEALLIFNSDNQKLKGELSWHKRKNMELQEKLKKFQLEIDSFKQTVESMQSDHIKIQNQAKSHTMSSTTL